MRRSQEVDLTSGAEMIWGGGREREIKLTARHNGRDSHRKRLTSIGISR